MLGATYSPEGVVMSLNRTVIHPGGMTAESGRWSHASSIVLGGSRLIFVAGQTARREDGEPFPPDDFQAQFQRVYESLETVLDEAGASFDTVVSMRTFLTRRQDVPMCMRLRDREHDRLFPEANFPPNTLDVVEGLADPRQLIEIEVVAVVPE
jgi:enamine deaminase RidA (YjgF/YER057c/UK114 family)